MKTINKKIKLPFLCCAVIIILASSCVPTQNIREVRNTAPKQFDHSNIDSTTAKTIFWRNFISDPHLIELIDTALANNQELNLMLQRIEMSKNAVAIKKGEYLPKIDLYAGAEVEKVGEFTRNGSVENSLNVRDNEAFPEPFTNFEAGLSVSWELDIFKKLRNERKVAVLDYLATIEGKHFMVSQLVAEIASAYYELLALDNALLIINQNLEIQENALEMVKVQKQAARASQLAVRRFEAEVAKNQSAKFNIKQQIVETENLINFLLGRYPQHVERSSEDFITIPMQTIAIGTPEDLLINRPDVKRAELELEASKLDVQIAKAHFLPSLGIRGKLGLEAFQAKFLTETPASLAYSLLGDIVAPLINRNAIKSVYKTANNKQLQAVFEYEQTALKAFIEVSNQISNLENLKQNYELKEKQVEALNESIDLSIMLFKSARAEYTEVLLTQREALDAKLEIIETKRDQLLANLKLYQSLGGGWR